MAKGGNFISCEKDWQAEADAHTMAEYQAILKDKKRMNAAVKMAQEKAKDLEKRASAMKSVAGTKTTSKKK